MANDEEPIAVLPCPQPATSSRPSSQSRDLRSGNSPLPMLDRLVGELETAFEAALADDASAPSGSPLSSSGRASPAQTQDETQRLDAQDGSASAEQNCFEAVLTGRDWTVSLPGSEAEGLPDHETSSEGQGRRIEGAEQLETADSCSTAAPRSSSVLPFRDGRRLLRQVAIPATILMPLAIGAAALAVATSYGLRTAVEGEDVAKGSDLSAGVEGQQADELGQVAVDGGFEPEARLSKVQEPVTPRLVKTVRIREQADQAGLALSSPVSAAPGQPDGPSPDQTEAHEIPAAADQASVKVASRDESSGPTRAENEIVTSRPAERLQPQGSEVARTDEALPDTGQNAAASDRWPSAIQFDEDRQPGDVTAAEDQLDESKLAATHPPDGSLDPVQGTPSAPDMSAADAEKLPTAAMEEPTEPTRLAATTTHVNMRAGPTRKAAVVTVVPAGKRVDVIGCAAWCEVVFGSERGWIYSSFISGAKPDKRADAAPADLRIAPGMPLVGSDGGQIGIVRTQSTDEAGQVFFLVELAEELGTSVQSVWLRKEHFVSAQGQARVRFTRARLLRSLSSQSAAETSRGTGGS